MNHFSETQFPLHFNQQRNLGVPGIMDIVSVPLDCDLILAMHSECESIRPTITDDHHCFARVYRVLGIISKNTLERVIRSRVFDTTGADIGPITNVLNHAIVNQNGFTAREPITFRARSVDEIFDALRPGYATPVGYKAPGEEGHFVFVYKNMYNIEYLIDPSTPQLMFYTGRENIRKYIIDRLGLLNVPCINLHDLTGVNNFVRTLSFGGKKKSRRTKIKKTYKNKK